MNRSSFLSLAGATALTSATAGAVTETGRADVTVRIVSTTLEVAPGRTVRTTLRRHGAWANAAPS
ncbi:MAG: hypothetical protein ACLPKB_22175 [Xanthobacteraceae bacterium]